MAWVIFLEILFWGSLVILIYTYAGYPVVLAIWSLWGKKPVASRPIVPRASIVIAAWDEGRYLADRINNCLQQRYPAAHLEVIVVSDGSKDDTESVVRRFDPGRVTLVTLPTRMGKAAALNSGVAAAQGEIIVFADARQRFDPGAVAWLVSNFADGRVGAVSGELVLETNPERPGPHAVGLYWHLEKWIRRKEGAIDSVVGVTGAIYAIRRDLYEPLPPGTLLDDLLVPMRIAMRGHRVVFEQRALAFERLPQDYRNEFRRKVRTLAGNYQAISLCPDLVKPWRNRLFLQFVSHKVCRLAAPFSLVTLLIANIALLGGWLGYVLMVQVIGYAMAIAGWGLNRIGIRERWTSVAFTFCLLNYAALIGAIRFVKGDETLWNKAR
jgi:cellulose synthase/poly-beta-1,6-N-acetylglucosamine synthase-like glycosyltransferase